MLNQPTSSPMMTRIFGGLVVCAALGVAPPASKKLEMASAPSVSFRTPAPKSIRNLLTKKRLLASAREACDGRSLTHQGFDRRCSEARRIAGLVLIMEG